MSVLPAWQEMPPFTEVDGIGVGDRVAIVTSTGYEHMIGHLVKRTPHWLLLKQGSVGRYTKHTWVQISHVVTITKTEEQ